MRFKVLRPLFGDHGKALPGEVIEVQPHLVRKYQDLEARGVVQRYIERPVFVKQYKVVENKAVTKLQNK